MPTKDEFNIEPWDDGDKIITVNGKPIGMCLDKHSANTVLKWLPTAKKELLETWNTRSTPRCDQCEYWDDDLEICENSKSACWGSNTDADFYCAKYERKQ